jgi:ATP-binding cassette subfamily B protein
VSAIPENGPTRDETVARLPDELLERLRAEHSDDPIQSAAGHDLDSHGRYTEGYLVLTEKHLAHLRRENGNWIEEWRLLAGLGEAVIVEGLGMSLLRLVSDGRLLAEYRFTLRHGREMAAFQRLIERRITGKEEAELEPEHRKPDEKKIRCDKCDRVIPPWAEICPACLSKRQVLSRLLDFVKPYRWQALGGFVCALVSTLAMIGRPYLTKPMLDDGLGAGPGKSADYGVLLFYVCMLAGLLLIAVITQGVRQRLMAVLGSRVSRDIRDRTYAHLHKLSLSFFSQKPTGSLVTRITSDSDRIWDFVAFTLVEASTSTLTIVGVGVALFLLHWKLACIVLLPIPVMLVLMIIFHKKLHAGFERLFHRWSLLTAIVADALPGVRVIKAFSQERHEIDRFSTQNAGFYHDEINILNLWTLFGPVMLLCSQIGALLVWVVGGWWAVQERITPGSTGVTPGDILAFTGYMWMFYEPIHMVAHMDRMFNRAATSVQRIFEVLDSEPVIFSKSSPHRAAEFRGQIELRHVSFSYDGIRKVLRDVNLKIKPGEMIGLAGPSGGGKTTLVNLICRFYDVLEGAILIDGVDIRDYEVEYLRRRIGLVLQEPFLFHGTVAMNVAYGQPDASVDEIITAAKAANAHDFIVGFPDGYDTLVGERGHTLSGGERQRISVARAILHNPFVLILDEATSSVDTETEKLIQAALDRLVANRTTIAIAHRLSTLRKANRLIILDKGRIVEEGSHEELADKEGGVYAKLLAMQSQMQSVMAIGDSSWSANPAGGQKPQA